MNSCEGNMQSNPWAVAGPPAYYIGGPTKI